MADRILTAGTAQAIQDESVPDRDLPTCVVMEAEDDSEVCPQLRHAVRLYLTATERLRHLELDRAIACARQALLVEPAFVSPRLVLWQCCMLRGEFEQGLDEFATFEFPFARSSLGTPPDVLWPWNGMPLPAGKKLLLVGDQGFGDVLMFARYVQWARDRCPSLAILARTELAPLIRQVAGNAPVFERWEDVPTHDAVCAMSSLPRHAGTRLDTVPWPGPYLRADSAQAGIWRAGLAALVPPGLLRIGLVWAGMPEHLNDELRSMSLSALEPLGRVPGVAFIGMQRDDAAAQASHWPGPATLVNVGPGLVDFADTAALVENLDLIITVDSAAGHLAGAMGKPVWLLLPFAPDWRWLLKRTDSPWYPGHRLFRQPVPGDWPSVVAAVAGILTSLGQLGEPAGR